MASVMCFSLCSCSAGSDTAEESSGENKALEVDENLLTVEYTIPASFFENTSLEDEVKEMEESGDYIDVIVNDDGSVTAVQTKAQRDQALKDYREEVNETIEKYLNGDEKIASFVNIEYSESMDTFYIYVDPSAYSEWDSLYALAFEMYGYFYQIMNGEAVDDIDVIVNFINNETGETVDSASLQSLLESAQQEE